MTARSLRVGIIEPHLLRVGGIRRMVELANRLVARGHDVTFYLPAGAEPTCEWLPLRARVTTFTGRVDDELDIVLFNDEEQWYLLQYFPNAKARGFYALSYAKLYGKRGSWESLRANVDLRLANSTWVADMIEAETGTRPHVVLGGISHEYFHPVDVAKTYAVLCAGDKRPWKGTETIEEAARILGLPLERYAGKDLPQEAMAEEYCKADVFVVGSPVDGFGQPGLEALACGVPLVTTANGGSGEYAVHEETALVVPANDAAAMAAAIDRLRRDKELAGRLRANGLELVRSKFDWEKAADELERHLLETVERVEREPRRADEPLISLPRNTAPVLSIVTPVWNELRHTQRFFESVRQHTDLDYELIAVDNGSDEATAAYVRVAADIVVRNDENRGFAVAMNQGLARGSGRYVAFCNNDTVLPPGWASQLTSHLDDGRTGIAVPAITKANLKRTVRDEPGDAVEVLDPFEAPPPAVIFAMNTEVANALGGFSEEYHIASGEDTDLAFTVWVNGLDILFDSRILVQHRSKGTARNLDDWASLWKRNRDYFLAKWTSAEPNVPRLPSCPPDEFAYRLSVARSVAMWMGAYFRTRERLGEVRRERDRSQRYNPGIAARKVWRRARPYLPAAFARALERAYRTARA